MKNTEHTPQGSRTEKIKELFTTPVGRRKLIGGGAIVAAIGTGVGIVASSQSEAAPAGPAVTKAQEAIDAAQAGNLEEAKELVAQIGSGPEVIPKFDLNGDGESNFINLEADQVITQESAEEIVALAKAGEKEAAKAMFSEGIGFTNPVPSRDLNGDGATRSAHGEAEQAVWQAYAKSSIDKSESGDYEGALDDLLIVQGMRPVNIESWGDVQDEGDVADLNGDGEAMTPIGEGGQTLNKNLAEDIAEAINAGDIEKAHELGNRLQPILEARRSEGNDLNGDGVGSDPSTEASGMLDDNPIDK